VAAELDGRQTVRYQVLLTLSAEHDLESIHDCITASDGIANAHHVLDRVMEVVQNLAHFPERGSYPKELAALASRITGKRRSSLTG
jgi:toxin ParE1/3/4